MTLADVATAAGYPTQITRRALEDLTVYEVLERRKGGRGPTDTRRLSDWSQAHLALIPGMSDGE